MQTASRYPISNVTPPKHGGEIGLDAQDKFRSIDSTFRMKGHLCLFHHRHSRLRSLEYL